MTSLDTDLGLAGMSPPLGRLGDDLRSLAGRGTVQGLLHSERRCRALELSLAKAQLALQHQHLQLQHQTPHLSQVDRNVQPRMLELKRTKSSSFSLAAFNFKLYGDLFERTGRLRVELDTLTLKLEQLVNPIKECWHRGLCCSPSLVCPPLVCHSGRGPQTSQLITLAVDNSQLQTKRGDLERLVQDTWAHRGVLEQEKEALGCQVSELQSELFQVRSREQELQRSGLEAQAELTGCRQLNSSMKQDLAVLRQKLASSEQRMAIMESERSIQAARLVALETEREQLLSQKAMLLRKLWRTRSPPELDTENVECPLRRTWSTLETDAGGGGIEKEDMEEGKEEVGRRLMEMKDQEVHLQHPISENFPGSSAPVLESGDQMSALQLCEGLRRSAADINSLWVKLQTSRGGHKVRPVKYTDWEEMGRILQDQKDSLSQMEHMLTEESYKPVKQHSGPPGQLDACQDMNTNNMSFETLRADLDITDGQSNRLSQNEEEKATASRISNQWDLWKHDPLSANQITALVIELQQLRKVNEAPWEVQASPWDPQARDWLERVRLLKECVRQMERNEERLGALAGQNTEVCTGEACALFTTIRELGT